MSEPQVSNEVALVVVPGTGELIDLSDAPACVQALDALREYESRVREVKSIITNAIVEEATKQGVRSIELPNGDRAEISPAIEVVYDAQALEDGLRKAGMPEPRIRTIVEEVVSYKVSANEAKKAAAANPDYREVVESARSEEQKTQYVTIRKRRSR